jgi:ADP-ribose pyrophosphatase YjhB (NUDIX family)
MLMQKPEPLFNPPQKKLITAFDLFGNKHQRNLKNFRFRISTYGILRQNGLLLTQKHPNTDTLALPGGAVEIGEKISDALVREFKEETGLIVKPGKLISITEDFFTHKGEDAHGILIFYEVSKEGGKVVKEGNQIDSFDVGFTELSKLTKSTVQRVFWPIIKSIKIPLDRSI